MELTTAQETILTDTHRFRVLACGRKFGKTTLAAEELAACAYSRDGMRVMYVAPTLGDARRLMWDRLRSKLKAVIVKENDTRLELKIRTQDNGQADIFLGSWEVFNSYRGDEYNFIIFDEVQDYRSFWPGWRDALRPTLTPRIGSAMFMGTPKGFNHFYDLHNLEYKDTEYKSFKYTTYDNPFIPVEEIQSAKLSLPPESFAQEYLAEFRKSTGLVFKEFDRSRNLYDYDLFNYTESVAGVDFGYTNPTAIPHVKVKDGIYYVDHELYRTGMTDEEVADYVAAQRFNKVYPDPENAAGIETMRRKGINTRQVNKGADSIVHGINTLRELFRQNRLFIHTSCINLIAELESYSYADDNNLRNPSEKPLDKDNHAIDALRYVADNHTISKPFVKMPFYDRTVDIWQGR